MFDLTADLLLFAQKIELRTLAAHELWMTESSLAVGRAHSFPPERIAELERRIEYWRTEVDGRQRNVVLAADLFVQSLEQAIAAGATKQNSPSDAK